MMRLAALLSLVTACRPMSAPPLPPPPPTPSVGGLAPLTEPGENEVVETEAGLEPAPPAGFPLPSGVTVVDVTDGGGTAASFLWRAWFAGDPYDPRVTERVGEWSEDGIQRNATEAAYELYLEDVRDAGFSTESFDFAQARGFDFMFSDEEPPLDGMVRLTPGDPDDPDAPDTQVIEVFVGPRGG